jgi:hypothetical protein
VLSDVPGVYARGELAFAHLHITGGADREPGKPVLRNGDLMWELYRSKEGNMNHIRHQWFVMIGLAVSGSAGAHHSTAMYDYNKNMTLTGVVRKFQWINPHCFMQLQVPKDDGGVTEWAIETGSPQVSSRMGWTKNSLKPGDKVTVKIGLLKDGGPGGTLLTITLPDGKVLKGGGAPVAADLESGRLPSPGGRAEPPGSTEPPQGP